MAILYDSNFPERVLFNSKSYVYFGRDMEKRLGLTLGSRQVSDLTIPTTFSDKTEVELMRALKEENSELSVDMKGQIVACDFLSDSRVDTDVANEQPN